MLNLLIIFCYWALAAFRLHEGIRGSSMRRFLLSTPAEVVAEAELRLAASQVPDEGPVTRFISRMGMLMTLEMAVLLTEFALLGWAWFSHSGWLAVVALALVLKNLVATAAGQWMAMHRDEKEGLFSLLLRLPRWATVLDRISSLLSGAGFLAFFLHAFRQQG
jgi:hypothetical protein